MNSLLLLPLAVPENWSNPDKVDKLHALMVYAGYPALLFGAIVVFALIPQLARGAKNAVATPDHEWFGGPRQGTDDLAGPDGDDSKAGGASASW